MSDVINSPLFSITYNNKDISADVNRFLISIHFKDTVEGEASEFTIVMENVDQLWNNGWYPTKGATLTCEIGDMDCGSFFIDEVVLSGPPDIIEIKAVSSMSDVPKLDTAEKAALTIKKIRTKKSKGHENKTLLQIAQDVAQHNGLTLQGNVPNITIGRITQRRETDLKFLRRVSYDYGVIFRVMGGKLVFMTMKDIEQRGPQLTVHKSDLTRYNIKDKTFETFKTAKVKTHNQKLKGIVVNTATVDNKDNIPFPQITTTDTYIVHRKVDNEEQAGAIAAAALYRKNTETQTGTISLPGRETILAGNNIQVLDLGSAASGVYHIMSVEHIVTRNDSWIVDAGIKRISSVQDTATGPKKTTVSSNLPKPPAAQGANENALDYIQRLGSQPRYVPKSDVDDEKDVDVSDESD